MAVIAWLRCIVALLSTTCFHGQKFKPLQWKPGIDRYPCGIYHAEVGFGKSYTEFMRHYKTWVPQEICAHSASDHMKNTDRYPAVMYTPGTREPESHELSVELFNLARKMQFIFIQIDPYKWSWNVNSGQKCCGDIAFKGVLGDDVGFVQNLAWYLLEQLPISPKAFFAMGHGTGAVLASALSKQGWVHGVVALSGHVYEFEVDKPKPVFIQWSLDDDQVWYKGCCKKGDCIDHMRSEGCMTAPAIFDKWRNYNHCGADTRPATFPHKVTNDTGECIMGAGCVATSTFCRYWKAGHMLKTRGGIIDGEMKERHHQKQQGTAAKRAMGWLQRRTCSIHGKWDDGYSDSPGKECRCTREGKRPRWGRYCLSKGQRKKMRGGNFVAYSFIIGGFLIVGATVAYAFCCDTSGYQVLKEDAPVQPRSVKEDPEETDSDVASEDDRKNGPSVEPDDIELAEKRPKGDEELQKKNEPQADLLGVRAEDRSLHDNDGGNGVRNGVSTPAALQPPPRQDDLL